MEICFSDLQNKLIIEEKMNIVHAAILTVDIIKNYCESAKEAVNDWIQGKDISNRKIGEVCIADLMDELNCTSLQAVCILNAMNRDPEIFEDAVLALWKDDIIND